VLAHACSILDASYRWDMSVEEAKALGLRAIRHATYRDAFSGGFINVYLVRKDGWERIARVDSGHMDMDIQAPP
jgi:20S proteasome subunit beta 5